MKKLSIPAAILFLTSLAFGDDWPQFLGPDRDGVCKETNLIDTFPDGGPKVLWKAKVGKGYAGSSVRDGEVFLLDRVGTKADKLTVWDLATGKELWSYQYEAKGRLQYPGSRSTPAVDEKYVFTIGAFGHMHCIDRKTHEAVWSKNLLAEYGAKLPMWGVAQSPLLWKDTVIVTPLGPKAGAVALDKATGREQWRTPSFGHPVQGMTYASPMIAAIDGKPHLTFLATENQASVLAVGVDPDSGESLWSYRGWGTMWPIPGPMDLGDNRLLLSGEYNSGMVIIRVKKGGKGYSAVLEKDFRSKPPFYASQVHQPVLLDNHLYFVSNGYDRSHGLVCLSLEGGDLKKAVKWRTGDNPYFGLGGWVYADGKLYVMEGGMNKSDKDNGTLYIVKPSPDGYRELDRAPVLKGKQIWGPLVISDGKMLLRDQSQLICIDMRKD